MGDRTWTGISFSGHITRAQADELALELEGQGCRCDDGDDGDITYKHLMLDTCFCDEDCNYATMEGVEEWCKENHVTYLKTWSAGGGYGEGATLYIGVPGTQIDVPTSDGEAALTASNLKDFDEKGASIKDVLHYLDLIENYRTHYPALVVQE